MAASRFQVLQFIDESSSKVTFACVKRHFCETGQANTRALKKLISSLIQEGVLCYTSHYGRSFIEISYDRPLVVSRHVVIKPAGCSCNPSADQLVISLAKGASFGGGEHPTTRLAIRLIDTVLHLPTWQKIMGTLRVLDIGTGSGVLAILAAKSGVGSVHGIDTDPCAVFEARENIRLNQVGDRVDVFGDAFQTLAGPYDMVLANLRVPTLFGLRDELEKKANRDCVLIFSGIKSDETMPVCAFYKKAGYFLIKKGSEKGWDAICLARGVLLDENAFPLP